MSTIVIVEYEGSMGKRESYHGCYVDGWVDWKSNTLRLWKESEDTVGVKDIEQLDKVSCVKEYDLENNHYIVWTNPKYNYAVSINVEKVEV